MVSKIPFVLFIIQKKKEKKERKKETPERRRVSSDPQRSTRETKTNIDTAQEDARRAHIATRADVTLRAEEDARKKNGAEECVLTL